MYKTICKTLTDYYNYSYCSYSDIAYFSSSDKITCQIIYNHTKKIGRRVDLVFIDYNDYSLKNLKYLKKVIDCKRPNLPFEYLKYKYRFNLKNNFAQLYLNKIKFYLEERQIIGELLTLIPSYYNLSPFDLNDVYSLKDDVKILKSLRPISNEQRMNFMENLISVLKFRPTFTLKSQKITFRSTSDYIRMRFDKHYYFYEYHDLISIYKYLKNPGLDFILTLIFNLNLEEEIIIKLQKQGLNI
jgi:hypothetical protein